MTPIVSKNDERLATLVGVAIDLIERLALKEDRNPDVILAESLYVSLQDIKDFGASQTMNKLCTSYPILEEAIHGNS